jgi:hypothetical protein
MTRAIGNTLATATSATATLAGEAFLAASWADPEPSTTFSHKQIATLNAAIECRGIFFIPITHHSSLITHHLISLHKVLHRVEQVKLSVTLALTTAFHAEC